MLLVARAFTVFGSGFGDCDICYGVNKCSGYKAIEVEAKPPPLYASSIRSNDRADISTPLPNAIILATIRWAIFK
jgi:hypothetical protein